MPRRGENIYKRKDGRWEARYLKEITADGKKKYGSVYAKSYAEVKAKQQRCLLHPTISIGNCMNLTISMLMAEYLNSIKNHVKPNTYQKYESINKKHISQQIGSILVRLVSNYTIQNFTKQLLGRNLSVKTVNDILIVLNLAFRYAEEEYEIRVPKIRYLREEKKKTRVLTVEEQKKLTAQLYTDMDIYKFGVLLALYTGMRIGELCALQWGDITEEYIEINKTMMLFLFYGRELSEQNLYALFKIDKTTGGCSFIGEVPSTFNGFEDEEWKFYYPELANEFTYNRYDYKS